jgi:diguanylate cyclase (GGDEF)-like protein
MFESDIPAGFLNRKTIQENENIPLFLKILKAVRYMIIPASFHLGTVSLGLWLFISSNYSLPSLIYASTFVLFSAASALFQSKTILRYTFAFFGMTAMLTGIELYAIEPKHIVGLGFFLQVFAQYMFRDIIFSNLIGIMTAFIFLNRRVDESIQLTVGYMFGVIMVSIMYSIVSYLIKNIIKERDKFRKVSMLDPLTGLYNLSSIINIGQDMLDKDNNVSILVIDMDHFKQINDTYGHLTGNKALVFASNLIKKSLEGLNYTIGRLGGDEFIIIIEDLNPAQEHILNKRLQDSLNKNLFSSYTDMTPIKLSCSTGIAHSRDIKEKEFDKLLHIADLKMYENKHGSYKVDEKAEFENRFLPERCLQVIGTLKEKDMYTYIHSRSVARYAEALGNAMNLPHEVIRDLYIAGWLHDLGKIFVSSDILLKQSSLTGDEYEIVKRHVVDSVCILDIFDVSATVKNAVKYHHEHYDGNGYPYALESTEIPLEGRILSIADVFSASTLKHTYKGQMSPDTAVAELKRCSGSQFDPELVDMFVTCLNNESTLESGYN